MVCAAFVLLLGCAVARAAVAVLVEQPYGGFGAWNPTGHSALYFNHICAASPVQLRPCEAGELGVVISRYDGIGAYDWVAIPLVPYLYGVESPNEVPASADRLDVLRIRDLYRREHLEAIAPDTASGAPPEGNWYELVGSAYDRTIYGFQVKTTAEQDAGLIAMFNDRPNVTTYNGSFRNCADFARVTINRLYPHAVRRNYIADFGLTTPKSVARGLAHYARKHPEVGMVEFRIPQVRGDLPRSMGIEGVTESLLTRYGVPLTLLSPQVSAAVLVAYVGHGRFRMPKDAPVLDVQAMAAASAGAIAAERAAEDFGPLHEQETPLTPMAPVNGLLASPDSEGTGASAVPVGTPLSCAECMQMDFLH